MFSVLYRMHKQCYASLKRMANLMRSIIRSAITKFLCIPTMKGSLSIKKISGHTGRSGQVLLDDKPTAYAPIQSFVHDLCSAHQRPNWWLILLTRPLAWKLLWELAKASSTGFAGTWYRSRRFPEDAYHPKTADLGPPPPGKQGEGRYSEGKPVALYLSRSLDTAALECPEAPNNPRVFYTRVPHLIAKSEGCSTRARPGSKGTPPSLYTSLERVHPTGVQIRFGPLPGHTIPGLPLQTCDC